MAAPVEETSVVATDATPQAGPSWPLLAVLAALILAGWHQHFTWLWQKGWHNEYYEHGLLIPLISAYLIWRRREEFAAAPREWHWPGLPIIIGGVALHLLSIIRDVNFPQGFALVAVIAGLVIWLWGWPAAKVVIFPLAFLLFMVPMGRFLVDRFAQPMQLWSAGIAEAGASLIGLPVVREGTSLQMPDYRFEVAIACSGLKSAIAMPALGALYVYALRAPMRKRLLLFAMSLPMALAANAARIGLTLVMARSFGAGTAEGFLHTVSGLFVFFLALLGLLGLGSLIGCNEIRDDI